MFAIGRTVGKNFNGQFHEVELTDDEGNVLGVWHCDVDRPSPSLYRVDLQDQFCYPVSLNEIELVKK